MSNLAMYASEYNIENMNPIQKKKENMRNKTLKRREGFKSNPKIEAMVKKIHEEEEEEEDLSEFQPLGNPSSAGIERMEHGMEERMEQQQNMASNNHHDTTEDIQESFTQLPSQYAKQYYQQYVPYHNQSSDDNTPSGVNKDELLTKLNQIIYLLEEQQDENTGHVTEELILYSFLGVFIIFVVDSFARVGKYVR